MGQCTETAKTTGKQCQHTEWKDGKCKQHHPDWEPNHTAKRSAGHKMTPAQLEKFYVGMLEEHVINGKSIRETAQALQVNRDTVYNRMGSFKKWMKENYPQRFEPTYIIQRHLLRAESRRQELKQSIQQVNEHEHADRARYVKLLREEDEGILRLFQDLRDVPAATKTSKDINVEGDGLQQTHMLFAMDPSMYEEHEQGGKD